MPSPLYSFSLRAEPGAGRGCSRRSRRSALPRALRREVRPDAAHPLRHARSRARPSTRRAGSWHLRTSAGETIEADVVVSGTGQLNRPHVPDLPGPRRLRGHAVPLRALEPRARPRGRARRRDRQRRERDPVHPRDRRRRRKLTILQRSANWVMPRMDRAFTRGRQAALPALPGAAPRAALVRLLAARVALLRVLPRQLALAPHGARLPRAPRARRSPTTKLREMLTPDYPVGCKRILISDDYYQSLCPPERRGGDEPDRAHRARRGAHRRRPLAPRGHADLRDRLRDDLVPRADPDRGPRRRGSSRRSGATARRRTWASRSRASRTCSCSTARTRTSGTTRSSS